ncbi:MAG TPA: histidinol dehydrogenase [Acidimicrobiia bacterium]|nr:histidinol dehydrogenase [Acidimicrobiia bacterium]
MTATVLDVLDLRVFTGDLAVALAPPEMSSAPVEAVRSIIADVRDRGDAAVREYTARFDGCTIGELRVPAAEIDAASARVPTELRAALAYAASEIRAYHEAQPATPVRVDRDGIQAEEIVVPVDRAGCYAPGGRATYPSTVLMTAIPARVAGVAEVALCVPPDRDGTLPDVTLAAAALAGVDEVYRVGGVPAIAALAYGTETVPPVDVVVGPGNVYVTLAKREVLGQVGTDTFAGPSEVVIVADATADADLVAADLLAQAEHGPGGAAVLVTWHEPLLAAVEAALTERVDRAPRADDIRATLATGGRAVLVRDASGALEVANTIAPEHLELHTADPDALVPAVRNAGAVFCGSETPAAVGDYVAGVNHVLPTGRTARFASALRVDTFRKHIHVVHADRAALERVGPYVTALATAEGLPEHARSVTLRTERGVATERAS